jgi:hypothetical protein
MVMIVSKVPQVFNPAEVKARVEQAYQCSVLAVLPHSDDLMVLSGSWHLCAALPDHMLTSTLRQIGGKLLKQDEPVIMSRRQYAIDRWRRAHRH